MEAILTQIGNVAGVSGSAIFDEHGGCVAHQLEPPYDPILFSDLVVGLEPLSDIHSSIDDAGDMTHLVVQFDPGMLVVRRVGGLVLVVVADANANVAKLGVATNVATLKLTRGRSGGVTPVGLATAQDRMISPTPQGTSAAYSGAHAAIAPAPRGTSQSLPAAASPPAEEVEFGTRDKMGKERVSPILRHLLEVSRRYFGDATKVILKEELVKCGATPASLEVYQYADLIRMVSYRIQDARDRREFLAAALGDKLAR